MVPIVWFFYNQEPVVVPISNRRLCPSVSHTDFLQGREPAYTISFSQVSNQISHRGFLFPPNRTWLTGPTHSRHLLMWSGARWGMCFPQTQSSRTPILLETSLSTGQAHTSTGPSHAISLDFWHCFDTARQQSLCSACLALPCYC